MGPAGQQGEYQARWAEASPGSAAAVCRVPASGVERRPARGAPAPVGDPVAATSGSERSVDTSFGKSDGSVRRFSRDDRNANTIS